MINMFSQYTTSTSNESLFSPDHSGIYNTKSTKLSLTMLGNESSIITMFIARRSSERSSYKRLAHPTSQSLNNLPGR